MIISSKITSRIDMNIPGRITVKYDMISGMLFTGGIELIPLSSFKCIMTDMDGICEIDTELDVEVSEENAFAIQKYIAETFYGKTDFQQGINSEDFYSNLRTPENEFSVPRE
jgi:hypothetical protein